MRLEVTSNNEKVCLLAIGLLKYHRVSLFWGVFNILEALFSGFNINVRRCKNSSPFQETVWKLTKMASLNSKRTNKHGNTTKCVFSAL